MFDGRDPIYLQIADQIRDEILNGSLREEEQIMSTTQYATTYRINPATAAKAFAELVDEGVVYKRRGVGMFVADGARDRLVASRRDRFLTDSVKPLADEARLLGIPIEDVVRRLREIDAAGRTGTTSAQDRARDAGPTDQAGPTGDTAGATRTERGSAASPARPTDTGEQS